MSGFIYRGFACEQREDGRLVAQNDQGVKLVAPTERDMQEQIDAHKRAEFERKQSAEKEA